MVVAVRFHVCGYWSCRRFWQRLAVRSLGTVFLTPFLVFRRWRRTLVVGLSSYLTLLPSCLLGFQSPFWKLLLDSTIRRATWVSHIGMWILTQVSLGVFGSFHRRFRGVGVSSVSCAFMVLTYYVVLIAWVLNAFVDSFRFFSPWDVQG